MDNNAIDHPFNQNSSELLNIYNEPGQVIGAEPRSVIYASPKIYRAGVTHVWIIDSENRLLCSRRADHLPNGGKWQTFFGGHVKAEQTFLQNAIDELEEETNVKVTPEMLYFVGQDYNVDTKNFFSRYVYRFDSSRDYLKFNDGEVVATEWLRWNDYWQHRQENPEQWCNGCPEEIYLKILEVIR